MSEQDRYLGDCPAFPAQPPGVATISGAPMSLIRPSRNAASNHSMRLDGLPSEEAYPGMTLRDWFAGQALAGIMANGSTWNIPDPEVARAAYLHADNMLAQRAK